MAEECVEAETHLEQILFLEASDQNGLYRIRFPAPLVNQVISGTWQGYTTPNYYSKCEISAIENVVEQSLSGMLS